MKPNFVTLIILDGWGVAPPNDGNAITLANIPFFKQLIKNYPVRTLLASGEAVGLSWGEMGNSEVGHLNLGTGKVFYQNLPRIDKAIAEGSFFKNKELLNAIKHVQKNKSQLHLMGIISQGRVHGMLDHLYALLELCRQQHLKKNVFIHGFLDGRDTLYDSGADFVKELLEKMKELKVGKLATLSGRFYAMDRDLHWERTQKVYQAMVEGKSDEYFTDPIKAVAASYQKKVYDEEFVPIVIGKPDAPTATVRPGDAIIFFNFRADRARQLTKAFLEKNFDKFPRQSISNLYFVTMTEYEKGLCKHIAFPKEIIQTCLAKVLSENKLNQLHIAETEKYAHVTFFFNGGREQPFENESRILIPSPRVASYAETPAMSAKKITAAVEQEILKEKFDFIVINYANPDMVGHTGNLKATIKAIETVNKNLERIVPLILAKKGIAIITADHGNAEELINLQTNEIDKEHSTNPVPFIVVGEKFEGKTFEAQTGIESDLSLIQPSGILSDVAPTVLKLMNIQIPKQMTGQPLI